MSRSKFLAIIIGTTVSVSVLSPAAAHAQRRRVFRIGPRPFVAVRAYVGPRFYDPYWYGGWYGAGFPYVWYQPFPPYGYGYRYAYDSSIRFDVKPKQAEVFVDGYYTGIVDDFDGIFQRLRIEPGPHEIELYLNGYRLVRRSIYLQPGATFHFRQMMEPLQPGDTADPRPAGRPTSGPPPGQYEPGRGRGAIMGPNRGAPPPPPSGREPRGPGDASTLGTLAIRVQPGDAEVLVDGERWQGPSGSERLNVQLPEGEHRVEVRRSGFDAYVTTVRIRRGETTPFNISLARE